MTEDASSQAAVCGGLGRWRQPFAWGSWQKKVVSPERQQGGEIHLPLASLDFLWIFPAKTLQ